MTMRMIQFLTRWAWSWIPLLLLAVVLVDNMGSLRAQTPLPAER
jgi:hypothetical protein